MEKKKCRKCKRILPLSGFHNRSDGHGDGHFTLCKNCENERGRKKYWKYYEKERLRGRLKNQRYKISALEHYGKKCACCGESEEAFLSIDHINNDGARHRKKKEFGGGFYVWLKKNDYPVGFQTLCYNCNWAKSRAGGCPHRYQQ